MTSPRSYAAKRTVSQAVAELRRAAGTQFDPAVVDAFSEMTVDLIWPPDRAATPDHADAVDHRA